MIAVISHDAGGAELLSSWILHNPSNKYIYALSGPAKKIFLKKIKIKKFYSLRSAIKISSKVYCSTGSILERKALVISIKYQKKIIAFLDHWVNYKERFLYFKKNYLPNEIWVFDNYAYKLAKKIFKIPIKKKKNYYLYDLKIKFKKIINSSKNNKSYILYTCDPDIFHFKKHFKNTLKKYNEKKLIEYFLKNSFYKNKKIIFRLHPSQLNKVNYWKKYYKNISLGDNNIIFSYKNSLLSDLARAESIIGSFSYALVVALTLKKKVFSFDLLKKDKISLPYKKIIYI